MADAMIPPVLVLPLIPDPRFAQLLFDAAPTLKPGDAPQAGGYDHAFNKRQDKHRGSTEAREAGCSYIELTQEPGTLRCSTLLATLLALSECDDNALTSHPVFCLVVGVKDSASLAVVCEVGRVAVIQYLNPVQDPWDEQVDLAGWLAADQLPDLRFLPRSKRCAERGVLPNPPVQRAPLSGRPELGRCVAAQDH